MTITAKWRQHIENWQSSGLSQAEYGEQQDINVRTFTARLSEYRKLSAADLLVLVPVPIEPTEPPASVTAPATSTMVFTHVQGHRLELSPSVSAAGVAELLRCLA